MANLDGPAPFFADPGPDQRMGELSEHVDGIIALVGADRMVGPEEIREVQRLLSALQAIGSQRQAQSAAQQAQPMSNETSDFGSGEGTEDVGYSAPAQDVSYMQG